MNNVADRIKLREIFLTFAKIGLTGFGGGMAIVALIERICVKEKGWLSDESSCMAWPCGQISVHSHSMSASSRLYLPDCWRLNCRRRLSVASFLLSYCFLALFYLSTLPDLQAALKATNPVVIGLILVVAMDMGRKQIRSNFRH
jgi:chromate transporter